MLSFNLFVISYIAYYKIGRFIFLSIPIPVFIPSDRFAWTGPLRLSFTDRRNSSLRKKLYVTFPSDTTGRSFRKSKTTLDRAPMVANPDHLRLTLSLNCKPVLI